MEGPGGAFQLVYAGFNASLMVKNIKAMLPAKHTAPQ
jgi:hypothetical protein